MTSRLIQLSWISDKREDGLKDIIALNRSIKELPLNMHQHTITVLDDEKIETPKSDYIPMELFFDAVLDDKAVETINSIVKWKYQLSDVVDSQWYIEHQKESNFFGEPIGGTYIAPKGMTTVIPLVDGDPLYLLPDNKVWVELRKCLDPEVLMTHEFLGTDKLPIFISSNIRMCSDVLLKPRSMKTTDIESVMEDATALDTNLMFTCLVRREEIDLVHELSDIFPIQVASDASAEISDLSKDVAEGKEEWKYVLVKCLREMDVGIPLDRWLRETLDRIQEGLLPQAYYYPAKGDDYNDIRAGEFYKAIIGVERGREIEREEREVRLAVPDYNSLERWRELVMSGRDLAKLGIPLPESKDITDLESTSIIDVPGEVFLYETYQPMAAHSGGEGHRYETIEVELPDRYVVTNHESTDIDDATRWWRSGQGLSVYAFHYYLKTGKISLTVM